MEWFREMGFRVLVILLLGFQVSLLVSATTQSEDSSALVALRSSWGGTPPSWVSADPCGSNWEGIKCMSDRVISITLSSTGLTGQLTGDLATMSELQILDLSYNKGLKGSIPPSIGNLKKLTNLILAGCSFSGPIPVSIGSMQELVYLSLNSNGFTGNIPASIGNLSKLYWLDLSDNQLGGPIPVSDRNGTNPGLDLLTNTRHFHFGQNQLSGPVPPQLFSSNMHLIHVLFDNNLFTNRIPSTLGLVHSLEVVRFDRNQFSGGLPANLNNLTSVSQMILSNNRLSGQFPNLTGMNLLNYLDISNNSFNASDFPSWALTLGSLTTLMMENTALRGKVPTDLFSISTLQTVTLKNNYFNDTLDIGTNVGASLQLVDLQNNQISGFTQRPSENNVDIILKGNPVCQDPTGSTESYCTATTPSSSYTTPPNNCIEPICPADQTSSPNCQCSFPYSGKLIFRAPKFSDLGNKTHYISLQDSLMNIFKSLQLPIDSVVLSNPRKDSEDYLDMNLQVFPAGDHSFNRTIVSSLGFALSNQTFKPPKVFGPFSFIGDVYTHFPGEPTGSSSSTAIVVGAAAGACVLVILLLIAGLYAYRQKKRAERATGISNPFAHWDSNKSSVGGVPQLRGARNFSFDELKKCTNNFSDANDVGSGGYGRVYRGILPDGQLVAIKRSEKGSMQGGLEFKTEIELLSRVHHKNLVSLLGFCFERGEQMLVYEFIPNGSLSDTLSGKTGIRMDWSRRLKVTLGAARGLAYMHELANPPIIHRDVKTTNILLDERLTAKVADFGLSKALGDSEKAHVTTQVKGTMGYLDPEYYMTQQLTEKSDVYSFGVVMLEIITARKPIERGKYIVREVKMAMDRTKDLYNLHELLDSNIGLETTLKGMDKFVDLALKCVQESGADRPTMSDVVKEIENILQLAGINPNADSATTSENYSEAGKGSPNHPYRNKASFEYSGAYPPAKIEPK